MKPNPIKSSVSIALIVIVTAMTALFQSTQAAPLGTAFTYQGRLVDNGSPANGTYDLRFALFDALSAGSQIGIAVTNAPTVVSNGLFTVTLDYGGGIFIGNARFLQIGVRTNGSVAAYVTLTPRQELTPSPNAIYADNAGAAATAATASSVAPGSINNSSIGVGAVNSSSILDGSITANDLNAPFLANIALLNRSPQAFTGANIFDRGSGGPGRLIVRGSSALDTTTFTGLGFQYYDSSGEGAIMSSYDDGYAFLSFWTKQSSGQPIRKQMAISAVGDVAIDQGNANDGFINNFTLGGAGLTFGGSSGEGIASKRTAGGNQYGLDFYTASTRRMSLNNAGNLTFADWNNSIIFPGPGTNIVNKPMIFMFDSGTGNADRMVIAHSPSFPSWGLQYQDSPDKFNFLSGGTPVMTVNLGGQNVGVGTTTPGAKLDVRGDIKLGGAGNLFAAAGDENVRIVRGIVQPNGTTYDGTGFSIVHNSAGNYSITFTTAFTDAPALVITAYTAGSPVVANCTGGTGSGFTSIDTWVGAAKADSWFNFVAIGAR